MAASSQVIAENRYMTTTVYDACRLIHYANEVIKKVCHYAESAIKLKELFSNCKKQPPPLYRRGNYFSDTPVKLGAHPRVDSFQYTRSLLWNEYGFKEQSRIYDS